MRDHIARLHDQFCPPELALDFGEITELPARLSQHPVWPQIAAPGGYVGKILLSYHYFKAKDMDELYAQMTCDTFTFIDCGAFSAATQGAVIDIEQYAEWCLKYQRHFFVCSSLDSIGDPVQTLRNQQRMEQLGVDALPVFHVGEDTRYLEAYCEQYAYVALGGMVGYRGDVHNFLAKAFAIGERYNTVFHGFGQTRPECLRLFPFFSVDSSSWGVGHRYGVLELWDEERNELVSLSFEQATQPRNHDLVRAHGIEPDAFTKENFHHHSASKVNAVAWTRYGSWVHSLHGDITPRDNSRPAGLHLFLVDGASSNLIPAMNHTNDVLGGAQ